MVLFKLFYILFLICKILLRFCLNTHTGIQGRIVVAKSSKKLTTIVAALAVAGIAGFIISQNNQSSPSQAANAAAGSSAPATAAKGDKVVVAYQTGVDPSKVAQADGEYEAATGQAIEWRKFDSGSEVIAAVTSGDVPLGNIGSSPLAAAASQNVPIQVFFVASVLGQSEALVVNDKIKSPEDLAGKKIAVPYVSTTHYSLLSALNHWKVDTSKVDIVNLRPPEITAAWKRGDIDGAYVWEPALSQLKETGKVLTSSEEVGKWGAPTYDLWIVRKDFAEKNPNFLTEFSKVTGKQIAQYNADPKAYAENPDNVKKIANLTGSKPEDVALLLSGNSYLSLADQVKVLEGSFATDIKNTATFLKSQGKVDAVKESYADNVNAQFVKQAAESK